MSAPVPARPRRRLSRLGSLVVAAAVALPLAACGSSAAGDDAAGEERVYTNEFGTVELPETIERIVSVDFYTPAALLDIGVTPVGTVNTYFADTKGEGIPVEYTDAIRDSDAQSIGEYYELNLEAIVKAKPDLVLATQDFLPLDDPMRTEIEKVAPIITFDARDGEAWRTRSTELAKIMGKEDALKPLIERYNSTRDDIAARYADIIDNKAVTVFSPEPDTFGTFADTHFSTPILKDLGTTFREQQDDEVTEDGFPQWFSYEELGRLSNADVILMRNDAPQEQLDALEKNTIWKKLPAVQNDMVVEYIPRNPTGSFGWALGNLEDLDAMFAKITEKVDAQG